GAAPPGSGTASGSDRRMDRMSQDEFWRRFMSRDAVARREAHARRYLERELEFRDQCRARQAAERDAKRRAAERMLDFAEKVQSAGFHDQGRMSVSQLECPRQRMDEIFPTRLDHLLIQLRHFAENGTRFDATFYDREPILDVSLNREFGRTFNTALAHWKR